MALARSGCFLVVGSFMVNFLFWNIYRKPLQEKIAKLTYEHEVDVLMLAECEINPGKLLQYLNKEESNYFYASDTSSCEKIAIFTRFNPEYIKPVSERSRFTIRQLNLPALSEILLVVLHLPDKSNWSDSDQSALIQRFAGLFREQEEEFGHTRTVIVGDFNMNPFEDGIVISDSLHAVMSQQIALRGKRIVQEDSFPFFYNPMWRFHGNEILGAPGTYYHDKSGRPKNYYWNVFDQVLIRPDLIRNFDNDELKIIDQVGKESLLNNVGVPDKDLASDHLPIFFKLRL